MEKAILAGGCFWCIERAFYKVPGILSTRAGYTGGHLPKPTYEEVCQGLTGHVEAVEVTFDPSRITFPQILELFFYHIDPLDAGGQFADRGEQYHTVIFYLNDQQRKQAELVKSEIQELFQEPIATEIKPASTFYPAEEYHQGYCQKQPEKYRNYQKGHERRLEELWGKRKRHVKQTAKRKLTPLQYHVTQEDGTEPPFNNEYWDNHEEGIYVDIVSGKALFASIDKFESNSGWPSFTKPLDETELVEIQDWKLGTSRTELRSKASNSHLGHVFPDGPQPTGLRYCINSAAVRFIPKEKLKEEGYEEYLSLFE